MTGKRFAMIEKIKDKSKQELLAIPESMSQKWFENWKKRWHRSIISVIMPKPSYFLDLALAAIFFFPKLKKPMKGKRFDVIEEIKDKSKQELLAIPESVSRDWRKRWHRSIHP